MTDLDGQMADDADEERLQRQTNRGWCVPRELFPRLIQAMGHGGNHDNILPEPRPLAPGADVA